MLSFTISRVIQALPVVFGVTLVTFLLTQIIPGDIADTLLGPAASEEARRDLRAALGLDRSLLHQYWAYLRHLAVGDLGQSALFGLPVARVLVDRLANTALLAVSATAIASAAGIAIGTWVALKPGSPRDRGLTVAVLFLNSMPPFWMGLLLVLVFGLELQLLPVSGMYAVVDGGGIGDLAAHMILPTFTLAAWSLAIIARMTRSSLLEVINSDYIRTARSRGLSERRIVFRHALPNAIPAVITVIGLQAGFLLSGAVLTETVFSWPGIGLAMFQAISARDIALIQGGVMLLAIVFVVINFVVDVLYACVNPKIKLG
ncbi:MAG: ABC transporter permease [Alphaproteobacteria bacterium]|nr:ABC transporter permease [Alphaproteobacteria bacterium]